MDAPIKQECVSDRAQENKDNGNFSRNENIDPNRLNPSEAQDTLPGKSLEVLKPEMKLDIKLDTSAMEDDDDGAKTPPIPKKNSNPQPTNKPNPPSSSPPVIVHNNIIQHHPELKKTDNTSAFCSDSSTNPFKDIPSEQGYLHKTFTVKPIQELGIMLEEAQCNYEIQKRRSISAVNVLNQSLHFLERNIREILNINNDAATETFSLDVQQNRPKIPATVVSVGTDPIDRDTEVQRLSAKLTSLEKTATQRFKLIEKKRQQMLKEIKSHNTALLKLLGETQQSKTVTMTPTPSRETESCPDTTLQETSDLVLKKGDLKLQDDWIGTKSESSVDMGDYEIVIPQTQPETLKCDVKTRLEETSASLSDAICTKKNDITPATPNSPIRPSIFHQHTKNQPGFACSCGEKYKTWTYLWNHITQENPVTFKCDHCDKQFHSSAELTSHKQKEHNLLLVDDELCCKSCQKTFLSRLEIVKHKGICPLLLSTKERTSKRARLSTPTPE